MIDDNYEVFTVKKDLQNGFSSHNQLCKLASDLQQTTSTKVNIDFSKINFIAANLFSVLGCIFSEFNFRNDNNLLRINGLKASILDTAKKNGFCQHIGIKKIPDTDNSVIPYKRFLVDEIIEYEHYLTRNLFTRKDLPQMSQEAKDSIRDSLLELFKNVKDHTTSKYVYTCGQYFPQSYMLYFTIVDIGETIAHNVNEYHSMHNLPYPAYPLQWAMKSGNTTSITQTPRGIGLSLITKFVSLNQGAFFIISETETFEIQKNKERFLKLDYSFPGTVVTIGFNLHDDAIYYLSSETNNTIQF